MSEKVAKYRAGLSVRTSLILLLSGFTTALLIIVYAATTWLYTSQQLAQVDDFLVREAEGIEKAVVPPLSKGKGDPAQIIGSASYQKFLASYMTERLNLPVQYKTTLALADREDQVLASSNQALELDLRELIASKADLRDQRPLGTASFVVTVRHNGLTYRMIYQPILVGGQQLGSIRFACLLDNAINNSLDFAGSTAIFLLAAILLNVGGSVVLVIRILTPVKEMSDTVERISEENLHQRLSILPGRDELSHLSLTFNRALDRIAAAYRFQEDLVDDLSHQLRTPLTIMRSSLELAIRRTRTSDEYQEIIEDGLSEIDRLISLVNTMLTVAQLEGSRTVAKALALQPETMIRDLVDDLEPLWAEKELQVMIDCRLPEAFSIHADPIYLQQAIINILDNARKYTPHRGNITISLNNQLREGQPWLRIGIANEGNPIPDEHLSRIFDRFFHTENENDVEERSAGFGLGLNIARRIVLMHKGTVEVCNLPSGEVLFEISLPAGSV